MRSCIRVGFWRKVIDSVLDHETRSQMEEQHAWIEREPANPRPYFHLAQFCRMSGAPEAALGLLLEAVRLDPAYGEAHASLCDLYVVREDYRAAWRHARLAQQAGQPRAIELLRRHDIPEPDG